jgi:hypothetical protein
LEIKGSEHENNMATSLSLHIVKSCPRAFL